MKKYFLFIISILIAVTVFPGISFAENTGTSLPLKRDSYGIEVIRVQQKLRDLGFIQFRATGRYGEMTENGVRNFQKKSSIAATGTVNQATYSAIFATGAVRPDANPGIPRVFGPGQTATVKTGQLSDWTSEISSVFSVGKTAEITDFNSGITFTVERIGGTNHADVKAASGDLKTLKSIFGGGDTFEKRAVTALIDGTLYAASMFGMQNKDGSYCLYFSGSRSDIAGGLPDVEHESMYRKANGQ